MISQTATVKDCVRCEGVYVRLNSVMSVEHAFAYEGLRLHAGLCVSALLSLL